MFFPGQTKELVRSESANVDVFFWNEVSQAVAIIVCHWNCQYIYNYIYVCSYMYIYICKYIYIYICIYIYVYVYIYMYIYILYMYIHTYFCRTVYNNVTTTMNVSLLHFVSSTTSVMIRITPPLSGDHSPLLDAQIFQFPTCLHMKPGGSDIFTYLTIWLFNIAMENHNF